MAVLAAGGDHHRRARGDWPMAVLAATGPAFLRGAPGADMHRSFAAIKASGQARVARRGERAMSQA